jgi:putative phage-type endonuclease
MQQQTEAWREWRRHGIGASLAPGVMDVNPWFPRTPYEVFLLLTKRAAPLAPTDAMRRGLKLEAAARAAFEARTGLVVEPSTREHPEYPFLRASLDGITLDGREIVELKVPGREAFEALRTTGAVPAHYYWQVQQQLAVSGVTRCHLWVYSPGEEGLLFPIDRNLDDIARLVTRAQELWRCVKDDTAPPLTDRDTVVRTDLEWVVAAAEYRHAESIVTEWTTVLERARRVLVALMQGAAHVAGGGVIATRYARQGTVDYKAIVQARLPDVDLTPYRRPGGQQVRIAISAERPLARAADVSDGGRE